MTETTDAAGLVRQYLASMEARDLDAARAMLDAGFVMNFPGAPGLGTLEALIDWSRPRYRFVTKTHEGLDSCEAGDRTVVYVRGTLAGEWPDGAPFKNVRFIDRFEVSGGKMIRQDVWNDLGELARS